MPLDFPTNPANGDTYLTYTYDTSIASWRSNPLVKGPAYISDTPPLLAANGDMWFNNNDGTMFVRYDSNWVEARSDETVTPGSIVQVVHATTTTTITSSSTTQADTTLSASITPKFTNSKILISTNHAIWKSSGNAENQISLFLYRDSTQITQLSTYLMANGVASTATSSTSATYLDSPSTTSIITYKTRFNNYVNAASVAVQQYSAPSTMVLLEVAQ